MRAVGENPIGSDVVDEATTKGTNLLKLKNPPGPVMGLI